MRSVGKRGFEDGDWRRGVVWGLGLGFEGGKRFKFETMIHTLLTVRGGGGGEGVLGQDPPPPTPTPPFFSVAGPRAVLYERRWVGSGKRIH